MPNRQTPDASSSAPGIGAFLSDLVERSIGVNGEEPEVFRAAAMDRIAAAAGSSAAELYQGVKGQWRSLAGASQLGEGDRVALAAALDGEQAGRIGEWDYLPLEMTGEAAERARFSGQVLRIRRPHRATDHELAEIARGYALAWRVFAANRQQARRSRRLQAMLDATARWGHSRETDQLLQEMAEASTRLMGAERATLFLPDPQTGELVGRPALGVEGGEIRIAPDAGVVGQVVASGQPQRVDADVAREQAQIDRAVDRQLGFETRSLACVPMFNEAGKVIGAFEVINKLQGNFTDADLDDLTELAAHAAAAIGATRHVERLVTSQQQVADEAADQWQLIGECPAMVKLRSTLQRVAETDLVVLITGENGTGKEVVARQIHYLGPRRDRVLVAVNCAAITESLLESELFGHEKGAFTDAHESRPGKFELADGGTLFLDEIGDMTLGGQAKLLRVLEEKIVVRVGGSKPIPIDTRVIAATNQDLAQLVGERRFRQDLFFRLNVLTIELPPLRERGDDIVLLAERFLGDFCRNARRSPLELAPSARRRLLQHRWPGNVRELRNMMERLAYLSTRERVEAEDLEFILSPPTGATPTLLDLDLPLNDATREYQSRYIARQIERVGGNMTEAAEKLGLHRSNLYRKMRQLDMTPPGKDE